MKGREKELFDFWYAVNNTEIVLTPSRHLETFGTTVLNYHLVSELMDAVNQVRVRQGRMQASPPQIVTPEAYAKTFLEGFSEEAGRYVEWLKEHEKDVRILQYGYRLKQESFSEHVVTDNIKAVVERVKSDVQASNDPFSAVVIGVDLPWDVCLIKLFWEIIQKSARINIRELAQQHMFDSDGGVPRAVRGEIEADFLAASKNPSLIGGLAKKLHTYGLFEEYEDRFFSLVKASKRS
jgi:hypothetical protein